MENVIVNINSTFRDKELDPSANKFTYYLPTHLRNIIHMRLTSLEIPNVAYVFSESHNNNKFSITVGFITEEIVLDDANYSSDMFITFISDKFDTINTDRGWNLALTINVNNGKFKFTNDGDEFTLSFARTGNTDYPNLNYHMGFINETYTGTEIESESVINLVGINYFFIKINDINNIIDEKVGNAFAKVILNIDKYNIQFEDFESFVTKDKQFRSPQNFNKLRIEVVDYLGNPLDLYNHDLSMTIEFGYVYDLNLYNKIHNKGIPNGDDKQKYLYRY
jgi:hypothetical protein